MDLSVIIPARNEPYIFQTVDDIFKKSKTTIEVWVVHDGCWSTPRLTDHPNLYQIHNGKPLGLRNAVNTVAQLASGKYLMKCDAHCMFDEGFDEKLIKNCKKNWVCIPSRYSMDADKWERTRGPIDYLYLTHPHSNDEIYGPGFHGRKWRGETGKSGSFWHMEKKRKDKKLDEIMAFQGSCWFMHKSHFDKIGNMMESLNGDWLYMGQESIEITFKTWFAGGKIVRNKNTWYAHWHKDKNNYALSKRVKHKFQDYMTEHWMKKGVEKYIEKFKPIDGWS